MARIGPLTVILLLLDVILPSSLLGSGGGIGSSLQSDVSSILFQVGCRTSPLMVRRRVPSVSRLRGGGRGGRGAGGGAEGTEGVEMSVPHDESFRNELTPAQIERRHIARVEVPASLISNRYHILLMWILLAATDQSTHLE